MVKKLSDRRFAPSSILASSSCVFVRIRTRNAAPAPPGTEPHDRAAGGAREAGVQRRAGAGGGRGAAGEVPRRARRCCSRRATAWSCTPPGTTPRRRSTTARRGWGSWSTSSPTSTASPRPTSSEHVYHKSGKDVVEHLFTVSSALDSMVLGETQILGQVRDAYDAARRTRGGRAAAAPAVPAGAVGRQAGDARDGPGRRAAQRRQRRGGLRQADLRALRRQDGAVDRRREDGRPGAPGLRGPPARPAAGLQPRPGQGRGAGRRGSAASRCRSSGWATTSSPPTSSSPPPARPSRSSPARPSRRCCKRRRYRPMFLIDIAVPRDVEASVGELDRVYLYNLDDLQQVVQGTLSQRKGAIDAARAIVTRHVEEFSAWHRQREMGPAIDRLYRTLPRAGPRGAGPHAQQARLRHARPTGRSSRR